MTFRHFLVQIEGVEIDELRYFIEAAKEENMSRAARTLGITQSTLSHAVNRLETEFGRALFEKKGKNVQLTAHGKSFAIKAKELLRHVHTLKGEMGGKEAPVLGYFRIGAATGEPLRIVARAWNLLKKHESAVVELFGRRSSKVLEDVSSGKLEFGVCLNPQPYPNVSVIPIARTEHVVLVRANHPLLKKQNRIASLSEYPLATTKHLPGTEACSGHPIFKELGSAPSVRYYFDNYDVASEILLTSDAWALLPKTEKTKRPGAFAVVGDKLKQDVFLTLVKSDSDLFLGFTENFVGALKKSAKELGWSAEKLS